MKQIAYFYSFYLTLLLLFLVFLINYDTGFKMSEGAQATLLFSICFVFLLMFIQEYFKYRLLLKESQDLLNNFKNDCIVETDINSKLFNPLIERNKELKESILQTERFSTAWVHDIKLPLSTLQLFYSNNIGSLTKQQSVVLSQLIIEFEDKILQRIQIDKLSQINKDFIVEKINIKNEIKQSISILSALFIMKNISITMDVSPETSAIISDRKIINYALVQILNNSLNYSDNNSELNIRSYEIANKYCLCITDYGIGIPKSDINRVFEFGFTGINGRTKRTYASSGVGLHIVKQQFDYLGHGISIDSTVNEYTSVTLIFNLT